MEPRMNSREDSPTLRLALPKGHMQEGVLTLLADAGIEVRASSRAYRPTLSVPGFEVKVLKPQNIVEMIHLGSRDIGFAGADWVAELEADVVELLDTGLDPVKLVAAAPRSILNQGRLPKRSLVVATEYEKLGQGWIKSRGLDAKLVHSYGATEVFPPEDADCIIDNTATGATLRANGLQIVDELMESSTRLYAHPSLMEEPASRELVDNLILLLRSVLEARQRVMVELNVSAEQLESVIEVLPCMREPTVAPLHGEAGYAVRSAVPRSELPDIIPRIKAKGGTDLVVTEIAQIVP